MSKPPPSTEYLHTNGKKRTYSDDICPDPYLNQCFSHTICWDHFRINHYIVKSYQEFIQKKQQRGRALTSYPLDEAFFLAHDINESATTPDSAYINTLTEEIQNLRRATPEFNHTQAISQLLSGRQQFIEKHPLPQMGFIDAVYIDGDRLSLAGWTLPWSHHLHPVSTIEARIDSGPWQAAISCARIARPDVQHHYPHAPQDCGFIANFPLPSNLNQNSHIEARAVISSGLRTTPIACGTHARSQLPSAHAGD